MRHIGCDGNRERTLFDGGEGVFRCAILRKRHLARYEEAGDAGQQKAGFGRKCGHA
ncbi:hypothetical protein D3C71_2249950 [compost metagenome]